MHSLTNTIEAEITKSVDSAVKKHLVEILTDPVWITKIEGLVNSNVEKKVERRLDTIDYIALLENLEAGIARNSVDRAVQKHITATINNLTLEPDWITKIEGLVNNNVSQKVERKLNTIDFQTFLLENLSDGIAAWQAKYGNVNGGIEDTSTTVQLVIEEGLVVAQGNFVTQNIDVVNNVSIGNTLEVDNLVVKKSVNVDNKSWAEIVDTCYERVTENLTEGFKTDLVEQVLTNSSNYNIDFKSVSIDGSQLLEGNRLSSKIQHTGITRTGKLDSLEVAGTTQLNETLYAMRKRVGVNTDRPEAALSIWDEEVSISLGKNKKNTAYIGTARKNGLNIGVNNESVIQIDDTGRMFVSNLSIDRFQLSFESQAPGRLGNRGDIVFNSDPKEGTPFAWVCTGNYNWREMRGH